MKQTDIDIGGQITMTVRKMLYPSPLIHWMEGLTQAERIGRIKRSKQSVLRYGIRQFLVSQINVASDAYVDHKVAVCPMDDEVIVSLKKVGYENNVIVPYPDWLLDFLEEEENFALLLPDCEEKLGEVLQRIYEWCRTHPPYDLLVK